MFSGTAELLILSSFKPVPTRGLALKDVKMLHDLLRRMEIRGDIRVQ